MEHRLFATPLAAACLGAVFQSASEAQSPAPRRADGRPDLEGVWDFRTLTPLERPSEAGDRAVLADEVAAAFTPPDDEGGAIRQVGSYFMDIDGDRPVRYRGGGIGGPALKIEGSASGAS